MKKYRVNTTISLKHRDILKKHTEKYGTQQRVLENALESLENKTNYYHPLSTEEELWIRVGREIKDILTIFQRDLAKMLLDTADMEQYREYIKNVNPAMFAVEWYYNKSLKECTLQEVMDALILNIKTQSSADTINCTENDHFYMIHLTHNFGIKASEMLAMMNYMALESYGAKFESNFSERSIMFKVFK